MKEEKVIVAHFTTAHPLVSFALVGNRFVFSVAGRGGQLGESSGERKRGGRGWGRLVSRRTSARGGDDQFRGKFTIYRFVCCRLFVF